MKKPRHYFSGYEEWLSVTADEVPATEPERLDTGLLDADGQPIRRTPQRVRMGFRIP